MPETNIKDPKGRKLTKGRIFLLILIAIPVYYWLAYPSYTYRYRMTVEIDTPEGVKSGSSVIEVHTVQWPYWLRHLFGGRVYKSTYKGEAPVVELGRKNLIVATLADFGAKPFATRIIPYTLPMSESKRTFGYAWPENRSIHYYGTLKNASGIIPEDKLPRLVTFGDTNDIGSMIPVRPNDFEARFGNGFKFKRIKLEMTNDSVTWGIENKIPAFLGDDKWSNKFLEWNESYAFSTRGNAI